MPRSAGSETSEKSSSEFSAKVSKSSSLQKQSAVVCTEVFDEHSSPTEDGKYILKSGFLKNVQGADS